MNDEQIIELYFHRDEAAIIETSRKYGGYLFTIAGSILESALDCEECINDTWLHTWNSIPPKRPNVFKLFLAKITRNLSFDRYRANQAKKRGGSEVTLALEELSECIPGSSDVESSVLISSLGEDLNRFVKSLNTRDGNIFLRRYFYTESIDSIADRYHMKSRNVLNILSRTRKKLKGYLEKEGYAV